MKKKVIGSSFIGGLILFVTISVIVAIAILVNNKIQLSNLSKGEGIGVLFVVILSLSGVCILIDYLRRKLMIERPTNKILEATDKIASGDFSVRVEITHSANRYDEYDHIIDNLNRMSAELEKNEVLHTDFISNVSHEIKTPIAVIQSYAMLLKNDNLDNDSRMQYTDILINTSKKITALVSNILKLNKLENSKLLPKYEKVNLEEVSSEVLLQYEDAIDKKNINVDCNIEEVSIMSSRDYVEIVLNNLLSNAIKFTQNGGNISLSVTSNDEGALIKVQDDGLGISKETGDRIFEKFYQCDTSHSHEGNGLGLALVKKVIDLIGGEISIESEIGKGSTFSVQLKDNER